MANTCFMLAQAGNGAAPSGTPGQQQPPSAFSMLPMLLFMLAAMYLLLIRPQQKQRKELQKLVSEVKSGDKVVISGGIYGTIANVKEKTFMLRIADGVKVEVDKSSIVRVVEKSTTESAPEETKSK